MPRKRHVSRNALLINEGAEEGVMPRKRHVSRNYRRVYHRKENNGHASQEACE